MENNKSIKESAKRNVLTSGLLATYPFISSTIFDQNGIFIGTNIYNNSLVFIDRYDNQKYKNANICIFGTSGAGKSFYTKLLILRYKLLGIKQYIIDPEREYNNLCNTLKGIEIKIGPNSNTYINVLEIRKESVEEGEKFKVVADCRHGADAAADGGDAVCAARSAGHHPGALGRGRLARPLWQPVGAAAPRRDRAVSWHFAAARFLFPPAQGDAHRRAAHPGCL